MREDDFSQKALLSQLDISADLSHEFSSQAAYYAHWAYAHARAQDQVRLLEERADLLFSRLYQEYRSDNSAAKENDCKAFIRQDRQYKAVQKRLRRARYNADVLKAGVRAFEMRRDMLIQLGAQFRAEQDASAMAPAKSRVESQKRRGTAARRVSEKLKRQARGRR
jgi:hypothetical protein